MIQRRGKPAIPVLAVVVVAMLQLGPLLTGRGFALVGDMVFVPHQPWKGQWLAADGSVPRAVPVDAIVSLLTQAVPGDLLQKVVLLGILVGAGWGMLHLLRECAVGARLVGAVLFMWNPYVYERLGIGHWALLCGYAVLPWLAASTLRLRRGEPGGVGATTGLLALAAWTSPTGGVLAGVLALLVVLPRLRAVAFVLVTTLLVNLPWVLPGILNASGSASDVSGVSAFAATSDQPYGLLGSVLAFGGLWKTSVAPDLEPVWLYGILALVVALTGTVGGLWAAIQGRPLARKLMAVAGGGLVLALLPTTGWGESIVVHLVEHVPGAGILRDSQKWLAPYVLFSACGAGWLVDGWTVRFPQSRKAFGLLAIAPLLALPTMAWGLGGVLRPVSYPEEWSRVAQQMDAVDGDQSRTLVLPWSTYRRFAWAHGRAVLDPAFRFFPGQVLSDDDLLVGRAMVRGESPIGPRVRTALERGSLDGALGDLDVRWLLVEKGTPGSGRLPALPGTVVHQGRDLELRDVGKSGTIVRSRYATLYYVIDISVAVGVLGAMAASVLGRRRRTRILGEALSSEG